MKRFLSMALATGLMLLTLPMMSASAEDTGDIKTEPVASAPADPAPQADPAPVVPAVPAPEPKVDPPADEPKAEPAAEEPAKAAVVEETNKGNDPPKVDTVQVPQFEGWVSWEIPDGGNGRNIKYPQPFVGLGEIPATKCEVTNQHDYYEGPKADVEAMWADGKLTAGEDRPYVKRFYFTYGGDCPTPVKPKVTLGWSQVCGAITLTTGNNETVPADWYYGLQGKVDGLKVVSAVQKGPGTKESTKTFAEDFNGGSVTVQVSVYAATEQDLLPAEWPYGTVVDVIVDTDCELPEKPVVPEPTFTVWVDGKWVCYDTEVTQTRTKTTYGWVLVDRKWVAAEPVESVEEQTRVLTETEIVKDCLPAPKTEFTYTKWSGDFACDDTTVDETRQKATWSVPMVINWLEEGGYEFVADYDNATQVGKTVAETRTRDLKASEQTVCPAPDDNPNTLAFTGPSDIAPSILLYGTALAGFGIMILTLLGLTKRQKA